jgi:hypothetical protein
MDTIVPTTPKNKNKLPKRDRNRNICITPINTAIKSIPTPTIAIINTALQNAAHVSLPLQNVGSYIAALISEGSDPVIAIWQLSFGLIALIILTTAHAGTAMDIILAISDAPNITIGNINFFLYRSFGASMPTSKCCCLAIFFKE